MMRKLVSLLAIMLMACPAVIAVGATYIDTFDNTAPDQSWLFQDEVGTTEAWIGGVGQASNSTTYTTVFGGTLDITGANVPPEAVFGLMTDSSFNPIPYGGSATVSAVMNPNGGPNVTDQGVVGFFAPNGSAYSDAYLFGISPVNHKITLLAIDEVGDPVNQELIDLVEVVVGTPSAGVYMDMPMECILQMETIPAGPNVGKVRLSALVYGDYDGVGGAEKLAEINFIAGVDTPSETPFVAGDVPVINGGATGLAGLVESSVPAVVDLSAEDYMTWDSLPGDFNLDGAVDVSDLGILATNYDTTTGATVFLGDGNFDGGVDVSDLGILATNYDMDVWAAAAAVPEPATMTMLLLGALALLIRRRR